MHLAALFVYPIKSLRPIALDRAHATPRGLDHDRRWMLVDARGRCVTQIEQPRLALVDVALEADALRVDAPGMPPLHVPLCEQTDAARDVKLFRRPRRGLPVSGDADRWFASFLRADCTLVQLPAGDPVSFANQRPFHLLGDGSMRELHRRAGAELPVGRFRPNFVVAPSEPHEEDRWTALRIGGASFHVLQAAERCAVTTVDASTGVRGVEPLRTLSRYRKVLTVAGPRVHFGRYLALDTDAAEVAIGDRVSADVR